MSDLRLIEAVKASDYSEMKDLIDNGSDINQQDEHGWTPLNFAAGNGELPLVKLLIEKGADPFKVGRDRRTPYMIALAAGRKEVVKYIREAEDRIDPERAKLFRPERKYCKAYQLGELRRGPGWSESRINWKEKKDQKEQSQPENSGYSDDKVVFIHQDFTVTEALWHNENVIFNRVSDEWREFCLGALGFKAPTDLDLIVTNISSDES